MNILLCFIIIIFFWFFGTSYKWTIAYTHTHILCVSRLCFFDISTSTFWLILITSKVRRESCVIIIIITLAKWYSHTLSALSLSREYRGYCYFRCILIARCFTLLSINFDCDWNSDTRYIVFDVLTGEKVTKITQLTTTPAIRNSLKRFERSWVLIQMEMHGVRRCCFQCADQTHFK